MLIRFWLLAVLCVLPTRVTEAQSSDAALDSVFERREVMIPMRDGDSLFTVILSPRDRTDSLPIIISRTPYGTSGWGGTYGILKGFKELIADGYTFVFQDIRGRFKSQGQFVMNRPPRDPRDPKATDESTDTYDTIDWLIRNVPRNNGRVGILGISYPGWTAAVAGVEPHPALKAVSPQAPMGDTWMGDDFFHQGAFRQTYGLEYAWSMEASSDMSIDPSPGRYDTYDWYLSYPTLSALAASVGATKWPTWNLFVSHPAYDSVWQRRALPHYLRQPRVPTLTVGGWWDQEDEYGPLASYAAMEPRDSAGQSFLVMGPWNHGQWFQGAGDSLGNIRFASATGDEYRTRIQARWFAHWLKGKADPNLAEATVYDAGANQWRTFDAWPPKNASHRRLYLGAKGRLSFEAPKNSEGSDTYRSDPAHPIPYRPRPVEWTYDSRGSRWNRWMTEDQRFVSDRADVLSWQTDPLTEDVQVAGTIVAKLFASTTGTDADWVVKLIDVYPDSVAERPAMGGYQLMIAGEILRGRYRHSFSKPEPIPANTVQAYTLDLHQQAYRFKRGHRIMVQVQSTWFPLYDRNPQTFVPNIFKAAAASYRAQTHRIWHTKRYPSYVDVMVLAGEK